MTAIALIAVIGGGAWGTALANAAASAGRDVTLWLRDASAADAMARSRENAARLPGVPLHARVAPTADPDRLARAEAALLVVPAQSVRPALEAIGRELPAGCPLVVCAKGIERGTGLAMTEVAAALRPRGPIAILSGPSFAADVARGLPTAVTLACRDAALGERLATALSGPTFRVYRSEDVRGVEIGGAAKNVLAIAAGIVIGRGLGESARAALVARGFAEMRRLAERQGARAETLMGLSGLGDLVLTCGSPQSRNFALGLRLGRGERDDPAAGKLAEGAFTADALVGLARASGVEMPISEAVAAVIAGTASIEAAVAALLSRPLRPE